MKKKVVYGLIITIAIIALAACSSLNIPGVNIPGVTQNQNSQNAGQANGTNRNGRNFIIQNPSKLPVEQKLAIGTLKLEGTDKAVTAQEAQSLLPLWKALKSMATSNNASADEINALYKQIEDTMTPDQVQAIKDLTWTQSDMTALMQQYGIQFGNGGGSNLTADQRATRVAQFRSQNGGTGGNGGGAGGTGGGGFFGGAGGGAGGFGGGAGGAGGAGGQNGQVQRTPVPGQASARRTLGLNNIFADPLIKLLQQRAGV